MKDKKGFTLIEVIISILLLGLIVLLFGTLMSTSLTIHGKALDTTQKSMKGATNIAKDEKDVTVVLNGAGEVIISSPLLSGPIVVTGSYYKDQSGETKFQYFEASGVKP